MSWWKNLLEGRRLRPQTVAPLEPQGDHSVEIGEPLRGWLNAAFGVGEEAGRREAEALDRFRADPERALAEVTAAYERAPEGDYALRWALVYGACQLRTQASLEFLERALQDPIPPERSHDIHHFSTVAEETSLRCRAISGIAAIAARMDDDRALGILLDQLAHPSYTVRVMTSQALVNLPRRPVPDEDIHSRLPSDEADGVMAMRRITVQDLPTPFEGEVGARALRPPGGESGVDGQEAGERRPPRVPYVP
jgi:hypothetical protein